MCGIVGYIGTKKAVPVLIKGLLSLEYRGYDSAGLAVLNTPENLSINKNSKIYELKVVKDKGRVKNLESNDELSKLNGVIGIAHTRWATHGIPSKINAHPHLDNSNTFAVVHNGIIENYNELKSKLLENGYKLYSQTDTEVIPNLINMKYKQLINKSSMSSNNNLESIILHAISDTLKDLKGSYAIEVLTPLLPNEIIVAKKDSPLVIGVGNCENYVASDIPAILSYTNNFYFLGEQEISVIKKEKIEFYDLNLNKLSKEIKSIEWDAISSEKNGYEDYMLKEIYEQPTAVRETIGANLVKGKKINLNIKINFKNINKIYIVACGTAMHTGLATKYAFEHFCKIPTTVDMASEFRYRDPLIDDQTLCIFVSQSGETADTIAALKLAKLKNCPTIAIVNVIDSSITRIADYTLYTHAGPEIAVASTKAYTCQVTLLSILAAYIAEQLNGKNSNDEIEEFKNNILNLPEKIKETLLNSEKVKDFSNRIFSEKDVFFIGRGSDYAVSMEGSLKLKEISYIHSEAYAAGELKHGPIALIEDDVSVVGIITDKHISEKTMSNLEEVITRGAKVLLITNQSSNLNTDKINFMISIPECTPTLSPILSVIPLQLLAYYIAKAKELDVDKPRNLAKSVTVE